MRQAQYERWGKRAFDIVVGTMMAIVAIPLIIVLAIGSAIAFRAWPIFVHRRTGRFGRPFSFPKIRSLPPTAPRAADKYVILLGVETNAFGRFLRRTHLDELPQLFLVPFGRLSLVGPRPEMPELADKYPTSFAVARTRVRPGCTGLWQISKASDGLIPENPQYDDAYVANVSWRLDLWVLIRSLRVLFGATKIEMETVPAPLVLARRPQRVPELQPSSAPVNEPASHDRVGAIRT
jgi:lipopolysaccharide/colanic/teichoic acid biosynthesis glycosyltransferase